MAILNEKNDITKKKIHLMITSRCNRKCPDCCNNQYDIEKVEVVTAEEFKNAEDIFLTGGEPFAYADPCGTAYLIRTAFPNIKNIIVYTNAFELGNYLMINKLHNIDGLTISIKNRKDKEAFEKIISKNKDVLNLKSNWVYTFPGFENTEIPSTFNCKMRYWQEEFKPATDSIFRRLYED